MECLEGVLLRGRYPHILRKILLALPDYEDVLSCLTISNALHDLILEHVIQDPGLQSRLALWNDSHVWTSPNFELRDIPNWKLKMEVDFDITEVIWKPGDGDITLESFMGKLISFNKAGVKQKELLVRPCYWDQMRSLLGPEGNIMSVANGNDNCKDKYALVYSPSSRLEKRLVRFDLRNNTVRSEQPVSFATFDDDTEDEFTYSLRNNTLIAVPSMFASPHSIQRCDDIATKTLQWTQQALPSRNIIPITIGDVILLHNEKTGAVTQCRAEDGHCERRLMFPLGGETALMTGLVRGFRRGFVVGRKRDGTHLVTVSKVHCAKLMTQISFFEILT